MKSKNIIGLNGPNGNIRPIYRFIALIAVVLISSGIILINYVIGLICFLVLIVLYNLLDVIVGRIKKQTIIDDPEDKVSQYWWDVVGTILNRDPKSYNDSLEIIQDLREKYFIDTKEMTSSHHLKNDGFPS